MHVGWEMGERCYTAAHHTMGCCLEPSLGTWLPQETPAAERGAGNRCVGTGVTPRRGDPKDGATTRMEHPQGRSDRMDEVSPRMGDP